MPIQFSHSTIRPLLPVVNDLDLYLSEHSLAFAIVSRKGVFLAANDHFLSKSGSRATLGTTPLSHFAKNWGPKIEGDGSDILMGWFFPSQKSESFWNETILEKSGSGQVSVTLFRASPTLSEEEYVLLFRESDPAHASNKIASDLGFHFIALKENILRLILDLRDYEALLPYFLKQDEPGGAVHGEISLYLAEEPRWIPGSGFLKIESRPIANPENPNWISLMSEPVAQLTGPLSQPSRRAFFTRKDDIPDLILNLPIFRETAFYGWGFRQLRENTAETGTIHRKALKSVQLLSERLHAIRTDLFLFRPLEREKILNLYSRQGLIQALEDLIEQNRFIGGAFGLIGITLDDPSGIEPTAALLKVFVRGADILGRPSPTEFLLLLPGNTAEMTAKTLQRLSTFIAPHIKMDYRLNATVGACHFPIDGHAPLRLIRLAFSQNAFRMGQDIPQSRLIPREQSER